MHRTATPARPAQSLSHNHRLASLFSFPSRQAANRARQRALPRPTCAAAFGVFALSPGALWRAGCPPLDHTMRGEVNVAELCAAHRPLPEASFGERQKTRAALDASDQGGTLPHRPLYDSRGSSRRDRWRRGIGSTQRDSAGLVRGFSWGRVLRWRAACRVSFEGGGAGGPFQFIAAKLR